MSSIFLEDLNIYISSSLLSVNWFSLNLLHFYTGGQVLCCLRYNDSMLRTVVKRSVGALKTNYVGKGTWVLIHLIVEEAKY
jgi:hypothetical protein